MTICLLLGESFGINYQCRSLAPYPKFTEKQLSNALHYEYNFPQDGLIPLFFFIYISRLRLFFFIPVLIKKQIPLD